MNSYCRELIRGVAVIAIIAFMGVFPTEINAQPDVTGELELESDSETQLTYEQIQEQAILFSEAIVKGAKDASSGTTPKIERPGTLVLNYLNDAYLYCTVAKGTCPAILDTLLELELIQKGLHNDNSCSTMREFWRLWLASDREKRLNFKIKTGFASATTDFRKNVRPRYIKCDQTIQEILPEGTDVKSALSNRYSAGSQVLLSIEMTPKLLKEIAEKVPDLHRFALRSN